MNGMTLKQGNRLEFFRALEEYRAALRGGVSGDIVQASMCIHAARGLDGIPRSWGRMVRDAFNTRGGMIETTETAKMERAAGGVA